MGESETKHEEDHKRKQSIFYGLVELTTLSIKDNQLHDINACLGLEYFGFHSHNKQIEEIVSQVAKTNMKDAFDSITNNLQTLKILPKLQALSTAGNEINETKEGRENLVKLLIDAIPSLQMLDKKPLQPEENVQVNTINMLKTGLTRTSTDHHTLPTSTKQLDAMEQEYLSALKGEQDCTVVS